MDKKKESLGFIQNDFFDIRALFAVLDENCHKYKEVLRSILYVDVKEIEEAIDFRSIDLLELNSFILPAGSEIIS